MKDWLTVKEVAESLKCSTRYVRNMASSGKLRARKEGSQWLIHSSLRPSAESNMESDGIPSESSTDQELISWLRQRIEQQDKELSELRKSTDESNKRHDTIVLQLTRQIEQSHRMLEDHRSSWIKRIFRKS